MSQVETGLRLRAARRSRGLSVAKVSEIVGASPSTIKRWEAGKGLPNYTELSNYMVKLGAPPISPFPENSDSRGRVTQRLLRAKRRRATLTLEELSATTGISIASLYRYETGARAPNPDCFQLLATAYGCSTEETNLLVQKPGAKESSTVDSFLAPGGQPHYWLYRKLESQLNTENPVSPEQVLDLIHGFMIMGDHRGLIEAWSLIRLPVRNLPIRPEQAAIIAISLALARFTVTGDKVHARNSLARHCNGTIELPPNAVSHLARLATFSGELDEAEILLDSLTRLAEKDSERGLLFAGQVNQVLMAFTRSPSSRLLNSLAQLRERVEGPLQAYTLDVAELHMLHALNEHREATNALDRCTKSEATYGFGSPLAARIRRTIVA